MLNLIVENNRGVILNLVLVISTLIGSSMENHCHRYIVELNNELDVRGVMLNLASLVSAFIWRHEESDCQRLILNLVAT